jgi:iron complex transport system substrate-binding protein
MQICSFLPSATEILYALDLGPSVAGVTFECDFPAEAAEKPIIVDTALKHGLTQMEIDREVNQYASHGESLYRVDIERLESIGPDLIVTQDLCDVCAVSTQHLAKALSKLSSKPEVLSLTPHTLGDVFNDIERVGIATGKEDRARELVWSLQQRVEAIASRPKKKSPRIVCLEWLSPPFNGGHWVPEMIALAGGIDPFGKLGEDSYRMEWQHVIEIDPEIVLVMPCGHNLEKAAEEYRATTLPDEWRKISAVKDNRMYAVDATAYFSRPGPRLVTGLEIMYSLIQEDFALDLPAQSWTRL